MAELVQGNESGLPAAEPSFDPATMRRFVDLSAENELYYQITGSPRVYDANNPSVAANVKAVVGQALATGEYTDPTGAKCKTPHWDDATKIQLHLDFFKRAIPELQKKTPL